MTLAEALAAAVTCKYCGARMWPAEQLKLHVAMHELRNMVYRSNVATLKKTFKAMRNGTGWEW